MTRLRWLEREGARVALLAVAACTLFVAVASAGTWDDPYAPNDWSFSHTFIAKLALENGRIPFNPSPLLDNEFTSTGGAFREQTGLQVMTQYATTAWSFWNGLPLHPALLATWSAVSGLDPEQAIRIPLGGLTLVTLVFATAGTALAAVPRADARYTCLAPLLVAVASPPFALDMRVLMPSTALVALAVLLHLTVRRVVGEDRKAPWWALLPVALVPFWYYTVAYFALGLFATFLVYRLFVWWSPERFPRAAAVPILFALVVPIALLIILFTNGALSNHFTLAQVLTHGVPGSSSPGSDYTSSLKRETWRSIGLYITSVAFLAPLALVGLGTSWDAIRGRRIGPMRVVLSQWGLAGAGFGLLLLPIVGVSFLNRVVIYLTPVAAIAFALVVSGHATRRFVRGAATVAVAAALVITPLFVASAFPSYDRADSAAFTWMDEKISHDQKIHSSLEASSVLFRAHGFVSVNAFKPRASILADYWYAENASRLGNYVSTYQYLVLRDDFKTQGFEEFGPARQPLSPAAYDKFSESQDLQRVFDNGGVLVFKAALRPELTRGPPRSA